LRQRKARKGELPELDGSEHDWFEARGARCSLIVYVDEMKVYIKFVTLVTALRIAGINDMEIANTRLPALFNVKFKLLKINRIGSV
jgi:hypothetical protein